MHDVDEAYARYVSAKRSGGLYSMDDLSTDDDVEIAFALQRVQAARDAFYAMLQRKPLTGEDKMLTNDLKAALYKAERELTRLKRTRESAPVGHLL